jgi:hypothetical protein
MSHHPFGILSFQILNIQMEAKAATPAFTAVVSELYKTIIFFLNSFFLFLL